MTPKEKGQELYHKFYSTNEHPNSVAVRQERAKQCALICVEEMIKNSVSTPTDYGASWTYWMQVKREIENL